MESLKHLNPIHTKIIPFRHSEDETMANFVRAIEKKDDSPKDIFEKMKVLSICKYYAPVYVFEMNFYIGKDMHDHFSVGFIPEKEKKKLNIGINYLPNLEISSSVNWHYSCSQAKIVERDNITFLHPTEDADTVLGKSQKFIDDIFYAKTYARNVPIGSTCSLKVVGGKLIFIPIWRIEYAYDNKSYYAIEIERVEQNMNITYPHQKIKATEEEKVIIDANKRKNKFVDKCFDYVYWLLLILWICMPLQDMFDICPFLRSLEKEYYGVFTIPLIALFVYGIHSSILNSIDSNDGIDKIYSDIDDRKNNAKEEAAEYKRQMAAKFLENKSWRNNI